MQLTWRRLIPCTPPNPLTNLTHHHHQTYPIPPKKPKVTPFLLERIRASTGGKSLVANIALVKNNAAVGAAVARELAALEGAAR